MSPQPWLQTVSADLGSDRGSSDCFTDSGSTITTFCNAVAHCTLSNSNLPLPTGRLTTTPPSVTMSSKKINRLVVLPITLCAFAAHYVDTPYHWLAFPHALSSHLSEPTLLMLPSARSRVVVPLQPRPATPLPSPRFPTTACQPRQRIA